MNIRKALSQMAHFLCSCGLIIPTLAPLKEYSAVLSFFDLEEDYESLGFHLGQGQSLGIWFVLISFNGRSI